MKKKTFLLIAILTLASSFVYADMQSAIDALNAKDYKKAFNKFQIEAKAGNSEAQDYLGNLYETGLGVKQDYQKALYWYIKAVEQGNASAMNNLGCMYSDDTSLRNYKKAIALFEEAANKGIALAKYNLGTMYLDGEGITKDTKKAIALFEEAANKKVPKAQSLLGTIYYFGDYRVKQNYEKAYELTSNAAQAGLSCAQLNLGSMCKEGKAVKQDYFKAYMWYYIAFKNEADGAFTGMALTKDKLTKKQIAKAEKMGNEWMKTHKAIDTDLLASSHSDVKIPTYTQKKSEK